MYIWLDSDADVDGGGGGERTQWNVSSDRLYSLGEMKPGDRWQRWFDLFVGFYEGK